MHDWLDEGGKVFATHFHYTWFQNGPADFQTVATWLGSSVGSGTCNCTIDTSFPKGQTFHDWLGAVGGSTRRDDRAADRREERVSGEGAHVAMDL